jgi:hypothetical protein
MRVAVPSTVVAVALALVPAATADGNASSNWSGYAAHGANFQRVSAQWRQPRATCQRGTRTYSAMWVGLGGYALSSSALEQVGTELDCTASGHVVSSAWYELVPAASHTISLQVRPGDEVAASIAYATGKVTIVLSDLTSHRAFHATLHPSVTDVTSAEWILEAPSACIAGTSACQTLPLTNFGHATFARARAEADGGLAGTISKGPWVHTRITLVPGGQRFVTLRSGGAPFGTAKPSGLNRYGGSFNLTYKQVYVSSTPVLGQRLPRGRVYLRH